MVPRWPDVAPRWRRLGTGAAAVVGLAALLQGAAPAATIPASMAAMVARPPEVGVPEPIPFAGDGLNHVLTELAALSAAGTIVAFEDGPDGRVVAVYDDGRRATVRDGAVVWLDGPTTTTPATTPAATPDATVPTSTTAPTATAPGTTPPAPTAAAGTGLPVELTPFADRSDVRDIEDFGGGIWRLNGTSWTTLGSTVDETELRPWIEAW